MSAKKLDLKKVALGLAIMAGMVMLFDHFLPSRPSQPTMSLDTFTGFYTSWYNNGQRCGGGMGGSRLLLGYAYEAHAPDSIVEYIESVCN